MPADGARLPARTSYGRAAQYALGVSQSFAAAPGVSARVDEAQSGCVRFRAERGAGANSRRARSDARKRRAFLDPRLKTLLPDPYRFAHMERAVSRFAEAVTEGETIAVFGDYDVDGACASALLLRYLRGSGRDRCSIFPTA